MAWTAGTVTVDSNGNVTGSGQALALYNAIAAEEQAENPLPDPATPPSDWDGTASSWSKAATDVGVRAKKGWARQARACATIATYATANASVSVTIPTGSGGAGLQRLPTSIVAGEPTVAPATTKTLSGSIT